MGRPKLLVVDDEPIIHSAIQRLLRQDFDVVAKSSAEEAVTDLGDDLASFDVVLLDVNVPGVPDGVDLFRRLEQMDRGPAVIFRTGDPHFAKVLPRTTQTRCLSKPFRSAELREAVAEVIEAQKA